jgi:hypothetical protein
MSKTRLEAFSDGMFAIIVTLLVLEIKIPSLAGLHDASRVCTARVCSSARWMACSRSMVEFYGTLFRCREANRALFDLEIMYRDGDQGWAW